jgi:uncharacterized SAM-binding protein YcdF (DUF218 family)
MLRRARRGATAVLAALGLLFLVVTFTPLTEWWARRLAGVWADPKGETLIVLGGSMLDNGVIGESSYWRGIYAARAYRDDGFRRVIVSGGTHANPASGAIRQFLISLGVPAEAILIETDSTSTRENAVNVARVLAGDGSKKVLLTSDYHMYRASRAFAKAGLEVVPRPFPDAIKRAQWRLNRWPVFLELSEEEVKIVYYYGRGWI